MVSKEEEGAWFSMGTWLGLLALMSSILPRELHPSLPRLIHRIVSFFYQYVQYTVPEFDGANMNELYSAVEFYLSDSAAKVATNLNLTMPKNASALTFGLHEYNGSIPDSSFHIHGRAFKAWWKLVRMDRKLPALRSWASEENIPDDHRSLILCIHKRDREHLEAYVKHVIAEATEIKQAHRDRKLFTNLKSKDWDYFSRGKVWESVPFKHPANFDTLAMDPALKKKIMDDLRDFAKGQDFYNRVGRAWKRGYLLYGPPGTGKSSMIAAMANLLEYDVYDLELTDVKSNTHLKNLLLKTSNKSIIVIEDIDCSLDLTAERARKNKEKNNRDGSKDGSQSSSDEKRGALSELTLSGLLNFTDGLWSCCGSERIFVFTTNHVEKLDPALLRSGRMDMHIHLSYCGFEAFRVLAKNYLKVENHARFDEIRTVMDEDGVAMTPAEISEVLTRDKHDADRAFECLVKELRESVAKRAMEKLKMLKEMKEDEEEGEGAGKEKEAT